ncbi:phosphopantetheine-binding protein [Streptomyces sp. NPDC008125]|uniref:acyl carrier protein n=1 Tax=Streptomyces sp. NPDC008125 TaxID=3364811 RepID=UPI0036E49DA5
MPAEFTLTELTNLLRECAGEDETVNLDGEVLDVTLTDLGYDSLAVLQVTSRIERDYGLTLDEESLFEAQTLRQYLTLVNEALFSTEATA